MLYKYLLNKTGLDLREMTTKSFVYQAFPGHLPEVGSVQPLLIEKIPLQDINYHFLRRLSILWELSGNILV